MTNNALRGTEVFAQNSTKFSAFFTACPSITFHPIFDNEEISELSYFDSLSNLKLELYSKDPLFLLVSVVTLLVALIGSAVFARGIDKKVIISNNNIREYGDE
jgi:hypothetical protein